MRVAFKLLKEETSPPIGGKHIAYYIIFDKKMNLSKKTRIVAEWHRHTNFPQHMIYCSVISRAIARICFTIAAWNGMNTTSSDVVNVYLNTKHLGIYHMVIKDSYMFLPSALNKEVVIVRA